MIRPPCSPFILDLSVSKRGRAPSLKQQSCRHAPVEERPCFQAYNFLEVVCDAAYRKMQVPSTVATCEPYSSHGLLALANERGARDR